MPQEPMSMFGWLQSVCVSDDPSKRSGEVLSAATVMASGMIASVATLYLAGFFHII